MPPLGVALLVWGALSIALIMAFMLGAAIGRRSAWENRRDGKPASAPARRTDVRASLERDTAAASGHSSV